MFNNNMFNYFNGIPSSIYSESSSQLTQRSTTSSTTSSSSTTYLYPFKESGYAANFHDFLNPGFSSINKGNICYSSPNFPCQTNLNLFSSTLDNLNGIDSHFANLNLSESNNKIVSSSQSENLSSSKAPSSSSLFSIYEPTDYYNKNIWSPLSLSPTTSPTIKTSTTTTSTHESSETKRTNEKMVFQPLDPIVKPRAITKSNANITLNNNYHNNNNNNNIAPAASAIKDHKSSLIETSILQSSFKDSNDDVCSYMAAKSFETSPSTSSTSSNSVDYMQNNGRLRQPFRNNSICKAKKNETNSKSSQMDNNMVTNQSSWGNEVKRNHSSNRRRLPIRSENIDLAKYEGVLNKKTNDEFQHMRHINKKRSISEAGSNVSVSSCGKPVVGKNECSFCANNDEKEEFWRSHALKDNLGKVVCPVLREYKCPKCGEEGDYAHTNKYCPETQRKHKESKILKCVNSSFSDDNQ